MKKINHIILGLFIILASSCKSALDVAPQTSISDEVTINNGASAETAVRGMYRALASDNYYGVTFQAIGYLSGDNLKRAGSLGIISDFVDHNVKADNGYIANAWLGIFTTINRANHIIEKVSSLPLEPTFNQVKKDQLLGEAYFVRALAYFDAARIWGGVPIYLKPTLTIKDNQGKSRNTISEVYSQVLSDLKDAELLLPNTTNRIRATKKTVWALMARVYLYQEEWNEAVTYSTKLIDDTNYSLIKPFSSFFANNASNTPESIFELAYSANETNGHRNNWLPSTNGGVRQWAPNDAFITLVNNPTIGGNRNSMVSKMANVNEWYSNMYYRNPATDPAFVLRIAEMRLIRAEALAQLDDYDYALLDLNKVRSRADLANSDADPLDKEEILLAIENERRLEFAFEPHRFFDLVRTDRAKDVLNLASKDRYVLPLPIKETLIDKALEQNIAYK